MMRCLFFNTICMKRFSFQVRTVGHYCKQNINVMLSASLASFLILQFIPALVVRSSPSACSHNTRSTHPAPVP